MKQLFFLLLFFVVTSCNYEDKLENSKTYPLQSAYEKSKDITIIHNEMLDIFYQQCLLKGVKFDKPLVGDDLPQIINKFVSLINNKQVAKTRSKKSIDENIVCKIIQMNKDFFPSTKSAETLEASNKGYLRMFCDEFYKINDTNITKKNIDEVIKNILNKVFYEYPTLSNEQIEELAFVSSVTYHSYIYWSEHAIDWYMNLKKGVPTRTRGVWGELWGAVVSGTKKWAAADTEGAAAAMMLDPTGASALAGAAGGSMWGAIKNLGSD